MGKATLLGSRQEEKAARARWAFLETQGQAAFDRRCAAIDAIPAIEWRGRTGEAPPVVLYTLRCQGTRGRGPHDTNVPEFVLWCLIDFRAFRCPYHT